MSKVNKDYELQTISDNVLWLIIFYYRIQKEKRNIFYHLWMFKVLKWRIIWRLGTLKPTWKFYLHKISNNFQLTVYQQFTYFKWFNVHHTSLCLPINNKFKTKWIHMCKVFDFKKSTWYFVLIEMIALYNFI